MSACFSRCLRVPIAIQAFYESYLWILQTLLLTHPDLHPRLLGSRTFPAYLLLCVSGFVRQIARTQSGASCLGVIPIQTFRVVPESFPENDRLRLGVGILRSCRPRSGRLPLRLAPLSCARPPPIDR